MVMLHHGRRKWSRAAFAVGVEGMGTLHDAPTVIAAPLDQLDHLPQILTDVTNPRLAGVGIETEAPSISEAVSPNLRARALPSHKRVVFRNRVVAPGVGVIDIQAHHRRQQVVQALAGSVLIRSAGAITGRDVEIPVGTDDRLATVMAAGRPFDDNGFRLRTNTRRIAALLQLKARDATQLRPLDLRV